MDHKRSLEQISSGISENSPKTFKLYQHLSEIIDIYNQRDHSSLYDKIKKKEYSPDEFVKEKILPKPKFMSKDQTNNEVANMQDGFSYERNKQLIDSKMQAAGLLDVT